MKKAIFIFGLAVIGSTACNSTKNCFDAQLKEKYKDTMCTMDCPGVTGCDGKQYCNECIAAQQGIKVK